jgi:calcineurin-like phosphoesterase family protein
MAETWFTADTHFNHRNILKYNPNRKDNFICPTDDSDAVEAMNQAIVDNWNSVVSVKDTVYHLGDVAFGKPKDSKKWVAQLNGEIHLIRGNHDYSKYIEEYGRELASVQDYLFLKNLHNRKVVLFHFPIVNWDTKFHGSYHFYGHVHGAPVKELEGTRSMDVGIDTHPEMRPYNWCELWLEMEQIQTPKECHHGRKS